MKSDESSRGFILASLLFATLFLSLIITYSFSLAASYSSLANRETHKINAQFAADAGIDQALALLNTKGIASFSGNELLETELLNNNKYRTTYTKSISDGEAPSEKILNVVGKTYAPANSSKPIATRKYRVDIKAVTAGNSPASVVSGVGGLILNGNAKISGGDVIVNGTIVVNNNAQIGLSTNPVNVRASHQNCPITYTLEYPRVCNPNENGQPVTANGLIYGEVKAQNQTNGNNMLSPGLVSSFAVPVAVPTYDRVAHKNGTTTEYLSSDNVSQCSSNKATWEANIKIVGDVILKNNCEVTIKGNVWITGKLSFGNSSTIKVDSLNGTSRPVIMIDSKNGLSFGNNSKVIVNNFGTGIEFVTTWWETNQAENGGFSCGGIPDPLDCDSVKGLALYKSQSVRTIDFSNGAEAPNSVLRSAWSKVFIANNGQLGAVSGTTVELGNNAVINFTSSVPGSDNLLITWVKRGYMRVY